MRTPLLAAVTGFALLVSIPAADWPQWRGPQRDGATLDPNRPLNTLPAEPKVLWQIAAGPGQSSPIIAGGQVIYMDGVDGQETAHALDAKTGQEQWRVAVAPMVSFQNNYGEGPRCTPLIDGDRVYVQSCSGEFQCLERKTGKQRWHTNFGTEYGATFIGNFTNDPSAKETASRRHGNNGSAAIDGDKVFVPVGGTNGATLVAFDKLTGKELWKAGNDNTAYSSVMVGTLAGRKQVVHLTADALMGVDAETGKILWREVIKTGAKRNVCTPVLVGDTVTIASSTVGTIQFKIAAQPDGTFTATRAWTNQPLKTNIATPVRYGSALYTLGAGSRTDLLCVDLLSGQERWKQSGYGDYASLTVVNDKLLALDSTGELALYKATPDACEELSRIQVSGKTWASPAYADGVLYVKDENHLTAFQLAE